MAIMARLFSTLARQQRQQQHHWQFGAKGAAISQYQCLPLNYIRTFCASLPSITITQNCVQKLKDIVKEDGAEGDTKMLRLSVEGGGCSGFQYTFTLDDKSNPDDKIFEKDGVKVAIDELSYSFVKGATIDFEEELIREAFMVKDNPNASTSCGCGSSFTAK